MIHETFSDDELLRGYRTMLLVRRAEERVVRQYAEQNADFARGVQPAHAIKCPTHLSIGQEGAAVGVCQELTVDDVAISTHRCHAHYLAKGGDLRAMMAELFGKSTGCARGKGGSMHLVDPDVGMLGASAIVGGSIPLAVGAALSAQMQGRTRVAVAFFGDGAVEQGVFHESLAFAALRRLPVLFVCENNFYATLSHVEDRQLVAIPQRATGLGVASVTADGSDLADVLHAARGAVRRARAGEGPTLIEVRAYRWMSHVGTEPDTGRMKRSAEELALWKDRCPLAVLRVRLAARGVPAATLDAMGTEVDAAVEDAVEFARRSPAPSPDDLFTHLAGEGAPS